MFKPLHRATLLFAIFSFLLLSCQQKEDTTTVERRDLVVSVYGAVTVKAKNQYQAYATVSGIVSSRELVEGDTVAAGQLIMTIENTNPSLNTQNAMLALELAQENYAGSASALKNLELQIQLAAEKVQEDSINFERQKNLWEQNIGSKIQLENLAFVYQSSRNDLELLKIQQSQLENELATTLQQAENNYQISLQSEKDFELRSRMDGKVYSLNKEVGELVSLQESLATIGDRNEFILELEIDQKDIAAIRLGQEVIVELDAYDQQVFKAKVSKIYPLMDSRSQTFKVEASFFKNTPTFFPGLTGEGNIVIEKKESVLSIPIEFLNANDEVMGEDGEMIKVEIGNKNMEYAEVLGGLEEGQVIKKEKD